MTDTCPEGHTLRNGPRLLSECWICKKEASFWDQQLARAELYAAGINPRSGWWPIYWLTVADPQRRIKDPDAGGLNTAIHARRSAPMRAAYTRKRKGWKP